MSGNSPLERVVVINDFSVAKGGATVLALLAIRLLRDLNIPVTLLVGDEGANPDLAEWGVDVVSLGRTPLLQGGRLRSATQGIHNPAAQNLVATWIRENDTPNTIYHVHVWSQILSPSIFGPLRSVAPRTVIHAHDFFQACPNGAFVDYGRSELCMRAPLSADCLMTNCDKRSYAEKLWRVTRQAALIRQMGRATPWGALVLLHERMEEFFVRSRYPASLLRTVRNPAKAFVSDRVLVEQNASFFFIGRVDVEKGTEDAIKAAKRAGVPLEVIGDGPQREDLQRQYPDVIFHGWKSREEIGALIVTARGVVMPSRYPEPFGLVAAEASMSGIPVILPNSAFLADELERNGLGFACDTRQIEECSDLIGRLRDMPAEEIRQISRHGFSQQVPLALDEPRWIRGLMDIYDRALQLDPTSAFPAPPRWAEA